MRQYWPHDNKQPGLFIPEVMVMHPEYEVYLHTLSGQWYEEPFDEDEFFKLIETYTDDFYHPEFVATTEGIMRWDYGE